MLHECIGHSSASLYNNNNIIRYQHENQSDKNSVCILGAQSRQSKKLIITVLCTQNFSDGFGSNI